MGGGVEWKGVENGNEEREGGEVRGRKVVGGRADERWDKGGNCGRTEGRLWGGGGRWGKR